MHDFDSAPDIFKVLHASVSYPPFHNERFVQVTPELSTVASSSAGVLVADTHGSVHVLNRDFESVTSWIAHVGGRVTHMVERKNILITLGVRHLFFVRGATGP